MASGVGGAGGGSRFPIPPGNGSGKKRVRFRDPLVDPEPPVRSAIDSINQTGEGSASASTPGQHTVTKDPGARPKTTQPSSQTSDWSNVVQQAANAARQWQKARQDKATSQGTTEEESKTPTPLYSRSLKFDDDFGRNGDYQDAESSSTASAVEHQTSSDEDSWGDYQDAESSRPLLSSSDFIKPLPQKPKRLDPQQAKFSFPHASESSRQTSDSANIPPPPPLPRTRPPAPLPRGASNATSQGVRIISSNPFVNVKAELLTLQDEFGASMLRSLKMFETSSRDPLDKQWFGQQIKKYTRDRKKIHNELKQLKELENQNRVHVSQTSTQPTAGFESATAQELADSLNAGSQSLDNMNRLGAAFEQLANSFEGRRLEFATSGDGGEPYYQTPIQQPHYQTPTSSSDIYASLSTDNENDIEDDNISVRSDDSVRSVETPDVPYYSIRSILRSMAGCLLRGLDWLIATVRAAYTAASEFIRRCCVRTDASDDNDDVYQVLGQQDSADYERMERNFSRFMESAYGRSIQGGEIRIPRARLRDDFATLEESQEEVREILAATSQSQEEELNVVTTSRRPERRRTRSSRSVATQTTHELTAFQLANRPLPPIGENVQDVVVKAKQVWQSLATANIPENIPPGRYSHLVLELQRILSEIDDIINQ